MQKTDEQIPNPEAKLPESLIRIRPQIKHTRLWTFRYTVRTTKVTNSKVVMKEAASPIKSNKM